MGLFGSKKNEFDHPEDGVIALVPPLSAPRVPIDDGEGRLTLGFRDDKSREAALAECSAGVIERCVAGAAGGCAVNAARACERSVPRPKSGKNPFSFVTGAFRSKEDKLKEQEELRRAYREARERCEADQRESCALEARKVCEAHSGAFCAAVVRGRGRLEDMLDESDDEERAEKVPVEEQKKGGGGESSSIKR